MLEHTPEELLAEAQRLKRKRRGTRPGRPPFPAPLPPWDRVYPVVSRGVLPRDRLDERSRRVRLVCAQRRAQ